MRLIDLRDANLPLPYAAGGQDEDRTDEERSNLVLAPDATFRFRLDDGNKIPWSALESMLEARLPHNGHDHLHDVSLGASDVCIDGRCGEDAVRWICDEILARRIVAPSIPVTVQYPGGYEERLGAIGEAARRFSMAASPA